LLAGYLKPFWNWPGASAQIPWLKLIGSISPAMHAPLFPVLSDR
jgi:hypothetical protein